jgi:hypothetical protein
MLDSKWSDRRSRAIASGYTVAETKTQRQIGDALRQQKPNALLFLGFEPFRPETSEHYTFNANKFSTVAIQVSTKAWP